MSQIVLGMPTLVEYVSLEANAALCQALGLSFVEINMNLPHCQLGALDPAALREIAAKYGIYFTFHLDENINVADFNPLVADAYLSTVAQTIGLAKQIGAPVLTMHMATGVFFRLPERKVYLFEQYPHPYRERLLQMREMCEREIAHSGIRVCIENTGGFLPFQQRAIEYLLDSSVFGLTFDVGHSHSADNVDEPFLMQREHCIGHMHMHDAIGERCHLVLGAGHVDLQERLALAQRLGARCVIEAKSIEGLKASVRYLSTL